MRSDPILQPLCTSSPDSHQMEAGDLCIAHRLGRLEPMIHSATEGDHIPIARRRLLRHPLFLIYAPHRECRNTSQHSLGTSRLNRYSKYFASQLLHWRPRLATESPLYSCSRYSGYTELAPGEDSLHDRYSQSKRALVAPNSTKTGRQWQQVQLAVEGSLLQFPTSSFCNHELVRPYG